MVLEQLCRDFASLRGFDLKYEEGTLRSGFPLSITHYYKEGGDYLFVRNKEVQIVVERFPFDRQMEVAITRSDLLKYLRLLEAGRDKFCTSVYRQFKKNLADFDDEERSFVEERFMRFTQQDLIKMMECLFPFKEN
jgi:hypothetical protein